MNIHEYGTGNENTIVLLHPSLVKWDYFEYVIPLLETKYHLVIPALPGYDPESREDFSCIEVIAKELSQWLLKHNCKNVHAVYGCSMGGSIALRMVIDHDVSIGHCILDGGITPYAYPWIITRCIAIKDFLLMVIGKKGGLQLLQKVFSMDEYSEEDLQYMADVFAHTTYRTMWRTFDSSNNYFVPGKMKNPGAKIHYWYGQKEKKERRRDLRYIEAFFPNTEFVEIEELGHGGLVLKRPALFAQMIESL